MLGKVLQEIARAYAPHHLVPAIKVTVEVQDSLAIIRLIADRNFDPLQKWGSLDARAQEAGSGIWATRGTKGYIPIIPVNGDWLVFRGTNEWEGKTIRVRRVSHPGTKMYKDRGYLKPAVRDFKKDVLPMLNQDIKDEIDAVIRNSFGGRVS